MSVKVVSHIVIYLLIIELFIIVNLLLSTLYNRSVPLEFSILQGTDHTLITVLLSEGHL